MPLFKYKAKNSTGKVIDGTLEIENEAALSIALRQKKA